MRKPLARTGIGRLLSEHAWSQALSRKTTAKRKLPISPNSILALRLRRTSDEEKKRHQIAYRFAASLRSGRLPILTLQRWLASQDLSSEGPLATDIAEKTKADWTDAFNNLAGRGWSWDDVDHWIWILSGKDEDTRVQRLISTDTPRPIFLLLLLLRSETFQNAGTLSSLMQYISKHHMTLYRKPAGTQVEPKKILTVSQFLIVLRRLVRHVQVVHPPSIVTVARLAANYIESIPNDPHHTLHNTDYHDQCTVYNTALYHLKRHASNQPLANMEFNWRAQKNLLTMSDGLRKPLIINKASYQAIRQVLVGLKKSGKERAVALRYAKSWPPYRQDFDGRDTKRSIEDDRSRSVKAGVLMQEAGYPVDEYDRALDVLGGTDEGSPTIQTRSLPPKQWTGKVEEQNIYSRWAMSIRATRNSQEAWKAFNNFAEKSGLAPTLPVYNEMFVKLQAAPVDLEWSGDLLPGDSRETFPVHDANYSQYELARLSPPTVSELYAEMMSRGIRPGGHGLHNLIINARSVEEGLRYLHDSGVPSDVTESLAAYRLSFTQSLRRIPLLSFSSYIRLLCKLQPNRQGHDKIYGNELYRIRYAVILTSMRLSPDTTEGRTFRPPWYAILRALARAHIAVTDGPAAENDLEALKMSMEIVQSARSRVGIDSELFILLCRAIQKAALSRLRSLPEVDRLHAPLIPNSHQLLEITSSIFSKLTTPIVDGMPASSPMLNLQYPMGPPHLHAYMRALAFLQARDQMTGLIFWMLDNYSYVKEEAERYSNRGPAMIAKTFCAFQAFASPALEEGVQQELEDRMDRLVADGGNWRWPTAEEVENYTSADARGGSEAIRRRLMADAHTSNVHDSRLEAIAA
ncbi:hypothetical protein F5B22DRAFT_623269 [Xylaria bambusicola]|uniref:uncharacterized protein n=1 Tax=Xylaria bambusicola TaxID=326684 RepID=UPI0020074CF7|nr:uncharacterized protein F5B22DRAFT_623269 [Xylaria bambusicola]KAI0506487.1 hypothetical protein F5B22DRAFT_623269 [Xylaria bambusicola]